LFALLLAEVAAMVDHFGFEAGRIPAWRSAERPTFLAHTIAPFASRKVRLTLVRANSAFAPTA